MGVSSQLPEQFKHLEPVFERCQYLFRPDRLSPSAIARQSNRNLRYDTFLAIKQYQGDFLSVGCIVKGDAGLTHPSVPALAQLGHVLYAFEEFLGIGMQRGWQRDKAFATPCQANDVVSAYDRHAFLLADETFLYFQYHVGDVYALAPMRIGWLNALIEAGLFKPTLVSILVASLKAVLLGRASSDGKMILSLRQTGIVDLGRDLAHRMAIHFLELSYAGNRIWKKFRIVLLKDEKAYSIEDKAHFQLQAGGEAHCLVTDVLRTRGIITMQDLTLKAQELIRLPK